MKFYLSLIALFIFSFALKAQDTIIFRSGEIVQAKILEVNETSVRYKNFIYQDGPLFIVSKEKIAQIKFADGSVANYSETKNQSQKDSSSFGRNMLSFNPFGFAFGNIAVAYEHFGRRGIMSIKIPLYFPVFDDRWNMLGTGIDFKFFPTKQGKVRYYLGPSLSGFADYYGYFSGGIMFVNGVSFQPFRMFNITIDGGAGMAHYEVYHTANFLNGFIWRGGIEFGLRF